MKSFREYFTDSKFNNIGINEAATPKSSIKWMVEQIRDSDVVKRYVEEVMKKKYDSKLLRVGVYPGFSTYFGKPVNLPQVSNAFYLLKDAIIVEYGGENLNIPLGNINFFVAGSRIESYTSTTTRGARIRFENLYNVDNSKETLYLGDLTSKKIHDIYTTESSYKDGSTVLDDTNYKKVISLCKSSGIAEKIISLIENTLKTKLPTPKKVEGAFFMDNTQQNLKSNITSKLTELGLKIDQTTKSVIEFSGTLAAFHELDSIKKSLKNGSYYVVS